MIINFKSVTIVENQHCKKTMPKNVIGKIINIPLNEFTINKQRQVIPKYITKYTLKTFIHLYLLGPRIALLY